MTALFKNTGKKNMYAIKN